MAELTWENAVPNAIPLVEAERHEGRLLVSMREKGKENRLNMVFLPGENQERCLKTVRISGGCYLLGLDESPTFRN